MKKPDQTNPWGFGEPIKIEKPDWGFSSPITIDGATGAIDQEVAGDEKTKEQILKEFAHNLKTGLERNKFDLSHLQSCLPEDHEGEGKPNQDLLIEAGKIIDLSESVEKIEVATRRNSQISETAGSPIVEGDYLHGMPLQFLTKASKGLFIPELYGDRTRTQSVPGVFVSQTISSTFEGNPTVGNIIEDSHTKGYGLKKDAITLIIDSDTSDNLNLRRGFASFVHDKSIARVISVGVPLPSIKGCVIGHETDVTEAKSILSKLDVYIPLFDTNGQSIFPKTEYDKMRE